MVTPSIQIRSKIFKRKKLQKSERKIKNPNSKYDNHKNWISIDKKSKAKHNTTSHIEEESEIHL